MRRESREERNEFNKEKIKARRTRGSATGVVMPHLSAPTLNLSLRLRPSSLFGLCFRIFGGDFLFQEAQSLRPACELVGEKVNGPGGEGGREGKRSDQCKAHIVMRRRSRPLIDGLYFLLLPSGAIMLPPYQTASLPRPSLSIPFTRRPPFAAS